MDTTALEYRCADLIRREADWAYADARREDVNWADEARDAAHDHVMSILLNDPRWEDVPATDISDIALEAANLAEKRHPAS